MRTLIVVLLASGCYDPDLSQSSFLCENECPSGFSCVSGRCVSDSGSSTEPEIQIVEPEDGEELDATSDFDLVVQVTNFTLEPDQLAEPVEGEGHWHWFIDDVYQSSSSELSVTVPPLDPGCHVLKVDLRQNQHAALDPPVEDSISVLASDGGPTICIEAPPRGETFNEGLITVTVDVRNFILDDMVLEGHGHWHVSIDGDQTEDHFRSPSGTVSVTAGEDSTRVIMAELVTNGELPLDPPRRAWVSVNVVPR